MMIWQKFFSSLFVLVVIAIAASAQGPYATPEQVKSFSKTKLLVVMDGRDVTFDALLRKAVEQHWNLTDFEFVNSQRFDQEKTNPDYSFLVTLQVQFDKDMHEHSYNYLYLMLPHSTSDIQEMPVVAQIPFDGSTLTSSKKLHKTEMLVRFIQNYASHVVASQGSKRLRKLNHLNRGIKDLKGKTLFFSESQISPDINEGEDFKKVYKHDYRIVSDEELVEIVKKAEKDAVVFHIVAPDPEATSGKCFKMIVEPATGKGYFYKSHSISEKKTPLILKRDFRNIRWYPIHWL